MIYLKNISDPDSVNSTDLLTRDCLTYAIQFNQFEIFKFVLKNGANVNCVASGRNLFLDLNLIRRKLTRLNYLKIKKDASTCLHRAVYKGKPEIVQLLLQHNANINQQDCFNRAPLHWSVVVNETECLKVK